MKTEKFEIIAKTFQGLEDILAEEITNLGGENVQVGRRMVSFTGTKELLYKSNLCCRTALRILKPIFSFTASSTDEVYEKIKTLEWEKFLSVDQTFAIDSVVYSEDFRHSKFVTYRAKDAIVDYFIEKTGNRPSVRINNTDLILNLHISHNTCTLSLDSSGESLHKRGYRLDQTEAPLNEVLAAGMILKTGWRGEKNFIDPMCGSGTLLIEAAMIATNTAPGIYRRDFAFERWKDYDEELFDNLYNDDSAEKEFSFQIFGSDISPKAIGIAEENIKSAGLSKYITLKVKPLQQYTEAPENGILVTNPPYGERISTNDLLGLYEMIGERLKHVFKGYDCWIISYREECFDKIGLKPAAKYDLMNGSLECEYRKYEIFDGKYKEFKETSGGFRERMREEKNYKSRYEVSHKRNTESKYPYKKPGEYKTIERKPSFSQNSREKDNNDFKPKEKPEILHGQEAMDRFVRFKQPSIQEDNRPGWKKLRDRNTSKTDSNNAQKSENFKFKRKSDNSEPEKE